MVCVEEQLIWVNSKFQQRVSDTVITTKFRPPYVNLFMDKFEASFLETQQLKSLLWLRYIDDIFFIWRHGEGERNSFLKILYEFDPCIMYTYEPNTEIIMFFI